MANRYRLYPAAAQESTLREHCAHARYVYNLAYEVYSHGTLETYGEASRRTGRDGNTYIHQKRRHVRKPPGYVEQARMLTEARAEHDWLRAGSTIVQQQALRDFDQARSNFLAGTHGHPRPRRKYHDEGFRVTNVDPAADVRRLTRNWGQVKIPKAGWVRFRWSRDIPQDVKSFRVTLDRSGRWHVSFPAPQPALDRAPTGAVAGIDRGVRTALVTSDGQHYRAPRISDRRAARYLALQQRLSRQQKGSSKREKTRRAMARITAKTTDRRKDWAEKVSTRLVQDHDVIVFEKLNTKDMARRSKPVPDPDHAGNFLPNRRTQKAGLNRGILASCWGLLATRTEQKAAASGAVIVYVNPAHSSQECRRCGHVATGNRESQAVFRCVNCGHNDHADRNAARNVLARGLALLTDDESVPALAPGQRGVRPRKPPVSGAAGTTRRAA